MNKDVFNQLIKNPEKVDPQYKVHLKKLVNNFPYSSNIRILYLSSLLNDEDVIFEQELKKTAAYIADRKILKNIITQPINKNRYIVSESHMNLVQTKKELKNPESVDKTSTNDITSSEIKILTHDNIEPNKHEDNISEKKTEIRRKSQKIEKSDSIIELDKLIISSAVNSSISIDIDKVSAEINNETNKAKSFLDWIKPNDSSEMLQKLSPKQKERSEFRERAEILIDQFIQNQPKIKPKAEFYSPENMARKSIEHSDEIVTETLAKVYAKQGNIAKAKRIYGQLILKNPEKKTYFASLIKQLETE
jgi:hypothetical protein